MSTLLSVLIFFLLFGTMFGLPVALTLLFVRHREHRLQQVLREIKKQYRLRGRGRAQLVGRVDGRPIRITRDVRRGVVVSVDLLEPDVRRRHAQWSRERAESFTHTFQRLRAHAEVAPVGERISGRWTFSLGSFPTTELIEEVLGTVKQGLSQEVLLAEVAAAASETEQQAARAYLAEVCESSQPPWMRAEAYRALIDQSEDPFELEEFGDRLADSPHPTLRRLSAVAWNRISDDRASEPIRALLGDGHPTVVETAARVLAKRTQRNDEAAEALLLQRLKSESGPLLFVIVRALGHVGSSRALAEMARWSQARTVSMSMREAVWRESSRIRSSLGLRRSIHGGQLSVPPPSGELSTVDEPKKAAG